jgi:hypothetical protein
MDDVAATNNKMCPCAAVDAVRRLHAAGARLFIISNSSRRSANTLKKLAWPWPSLSISSQLNFSIFEPFVLKPLELPHLKSQYY